MKKSIWGISALGHDASISVLNDNGDILFASESERYSKIKNDPRLNSDIVSEALTFGAPKCIAWFEDPVKKIFRQIYAGQYREVLNFSNLPRNHLKRWSCFSGVPITYVGHHKSHAAAGFFTSGFESAVVIVADAIGEWDTISIWHAEKNNLKLLKRWSYPHSIGLLYSAFTERVGLIPNEEEYILMGMAAFGQPIYVDEIFKKFFKNDYLLHLNENPHVGISDFLPAARAEDLAASIQFVVEKVLSEIFRYAKAITSEKNVVFMGGLALNCVANTKVFQRAHFKNMWIMPNPGDAGSSLGAAATILNKQLNWKGPFLGTEISGYYPVKKLLNELLKTGVVGVANGRAEFGPRALGSRSLLADPRSITSQPRMNTIKQRQKFRPFAPCVLEEFSNDWFDMPMRKTPYMQFTSLCRFPDKVPGVCHIDRTSRVQTVSKNDHPGLFELLTEWYKATGCPVLLNTSLNVKGQPMVNNITDAQNFEKMYGIKVFTSSD